MAKRKEKYPETSTFMYYNANPKNRITGDCAFRAISTALNEDYNSTVIQMAYNMTESGYALNDKKGIENYLQKKKWVKRPQPKKKDGTKYTGREFCNYLSINYPNGEIGNVIANIGGHHIVAIIPTRHGDGFNCRYKICDIWNPSAKCIGNYWTSECSV